MEEKAKENVKEKEEWKGFYEEGVRFFNIASRGFEKGKFTAEAVYNLLGMSIEKLFMGLLLKHKKMPFNHTFKDLIDSLDGICVIEPGLENALLYMDSFQEICSLDHYKRADLSNDQIRTFLGTAETLKGFISNTLIGG